MKKFIILLIVILLAVAGGIGYTSFDKKKQEEHNIATLISTYEQIKKATEEYQKENGCVDDIAKCISRAEGENEWDYMDTGKYFDGIAKKLDIKEYSCNNNFIDKDWLNPKPVTLLDGSTQTEAWEAPSKAFKDSYQHANCYYLFTNGAVMHVQFPDNQKQSGFGSVDVNGIKAPNKMGVDIFPIGWGAAGNKDHWAHKGFHPFWAEDGYASTPDGDASDDDYNFTGVQTGPQYRGLCRISCPNCDCPADYHSPTYYVLENKKLPEIK